MMDRETYGDKVAFGLKKCGWTEEMIAEADSLISHGFMKGVSTDKAICSLDLFHKKTKA
jgi:hypothetical protein